jgi:cytochrome c oxidase cbb3-type subunit 3
MKNFRFSRKLMRLIPMSALLFKSVQIFGQTPETDAKPIYSAYSDPLFYALVLIAVLLLIFILQLQKVLVNVALDSDRSRSNNQAKNLLILIALAGIPNIASASSLVDFMHHGFGSNAINALSFLIAVELCIVLYYVRMIKLYVQKPEEDKPAHELIQLKKTSILDRFNKSVSIEKEAAILTDHDYDGIRELDNALPPWWKYGFILTICWSAVYLIHYHVVHTGKSSKEEYAEQLKTAEIQLAEYRAKAANMVDETNVQILSDASSIAAGKDIFVKNCTSCHGPDGQGAQVGPNLTDDYWLHGGSIHDIFKTIKYGVQGKGMRAWKQDLTPSMIAQVASFIHSIHGSNPPNAKKPDGIFYQDQIKSLSDTTKTTKDTLKFTTSQNVSVLSTQTMNK